MTRPEQELAGQLVDMLDRSVQELDPEVCERLLTARKTALGVFPQRRVPAWFPAWAVAGNGRGSIRNLGPDMRLVLACSALVVMLAGALAWQSKDSRTDIADIDASLLADDLPITAYLDKGFDSWLKRSRP